MVPPSGRPRRPRRPRRALARIACASASALAAACLFDTSPQLPVGRALAYRMEAGAAGTAGTARVTVRIQAWPAGAPMLFQAPVYYPDNPVLPVPGLHAADLDVRDADGKRLTARDSASGSPADGNLIVLPEEARSFAYALDLAPADPGRFGLPMPGLVPGVDAIDGAYAFPIPVWAESLAARWRTPCRISLDFSFPGRLLVGSDSHRELGTPYELMFVRAALDPAASLTVPIPGHELTVYAAGDPSLDLPALAGLLADCIRGVEDSLLPLPTYRYFAGEMPVFSGIEGDQGYWFGKGYRANAMVHTHEAIHTLIGIRQGDLEDPWWKEGMTQYLGWLLPLQAGQVHDTLFAAQMFTPIDTFPAVRTTALASPQVRTRLFPPLDSAWLNPTDPQGFAMLVYGKGAQASMILDRWLLERSGGRKSAFDLVRSLAKGHGPAFTRSDLVAECSRLAGAPAQAFLTALLDRPGAIPPDSLRSTYRALRALGRFGPGGGKHPVAGIDLPAAKTAARPLLPGGKL